jgi:hypothetical protein
MNRALHAYLTHAEETISRNEQHSERATNLLRYNYICGLCSLPIGGAASLFAYLSRILIT